MRNAAHIPVSFGLAEKIDLKGTASLGTRISFIVNVRPAL
jgi:hypothetical protein